MVSVFDILAGFVLVSLIDVWRRKRRMHLAVSPAPKKKLTWLTLDRIHDSGGH